MLFEKYSEDDYEAVCDFLIELNRADRSHINWNWARFEWMYEHPEFDKGSLSSIGLWRDAKKQTLENGIGTKSQQALKLQQEQNKLVRKEQSRKVREAESDRLYELKQQKKKEKHKGH